MAKNLNLKSIKIILAVLVLTLLFNLYFISQNSENAKENEDILIVNEYEYPVHEDIIVTVFWVGEGSSQDNGYISNFDSVWDYNWVEHYGGSDDPEINKVFIPSENSFYFALPYNDLDVNWGIKAEATEKVYWVNEREWSEGESMLKNRWIKISKGDNVAYAQWEDSGPFGLDDVDYVFGSEEFMNNEIAGAGLDVSPAVKKYLGLRDIDKVDWQFVDFSNVEDGPWKNVITSSGTDFS